MRIRVYSPDSPFPPTSGGAQLIAGQLEHLCAAGHEVELVIARGGAPLRRPGSARLTLVDASTRRSRGLTRALRWGQALRFAPSTPEIYYYPPDHDIRAQLSAVDLAIYHYSFAHTWLRSRPGPPERRRVVHLHNIESDLFRVIARGSPLWLDALQRWNVFRLERHEQRLAQLVDELWFVSEADAKRFAGPRPRSRMRVVPPVFSDELGRQRRADFRPSPTLVLGFVGALDFVPNQMSLKWILRELIPILNKAGFAGTVRILGRRAPASLMEEARSHGCVEWLGFAENGEHFWRDLSFMLVPHIEGSGIRMKLLEALASGVPVLANRAAVAPLDPALRESPFLRLVSDDAAAWAKLILNAQPGAERKQLLGESRATPARAYDFLEDGIRER